MSGSASVAAKGGGSAVGKAILAFFWFYVTYAVRFIINLLGRAAAQPDQATSRS